MFDVDLEENLAHKKQHLVDVMNIFSIFKYMNTYFSKEENRTVRSN